MRSCLRFLLPICSLFVTVESHPPRCDPSLLTEYFSLKRYRYYFIVGHTSSSASVVTEIGEHFHHSDIENAIQKLKTFLNTGRKNWRGIHDPELHKLLDVTNPNCPFANVHPVLVGHTLNITIAATFDNSSNRLTVIIAQTNIESGVSFQHFYIDHDARWNIGSAHDVRTTIDMSRGLLHVVFQNNAKRMLIHEVIQIKKIKSKLHMARIYVETLNITISHLTADPTGKYLFYKMGDDQHQNLHIYRALSDHPHFSLNYANTTDRVLTVGEKDVFIAVDRNALVLWKFVDGLRTAWLYEGPAVRTGGMVNEFEKIGCVTPSFNDIDGQLLFKIHQVRLMH